jgi:hypothetical protein
MLKSRLLVYLAIIVILLIAVFAVYASFTYPKTALSVPVSFTIGFDVVTREFDVQFLNDKVQVQVAVESGTSLWNAQILNQSEVLWGYSATQGEQTSYQSDWIELPSGRYNFTFRTLGFGSLNAQVTVTSKGGFW